MGTDRVNMVEKKKCMSYNYLSWFGKQGREVVVDGESPINGDLAIRQGIVSTGGTKVWP